VLVLGTAGNEPARDDAEPVLAEEDKVEDCRVVQDKIQGTAGDKARTPAADVQAAGKAEDRAQGNVCFGRGKVGDRIAGGKIGTQAQGLVPQQAQDEVLE